MNGENGPGTTAAWSFPRSRRTPQRARRLLRDRLDGWGVDKDAADTAELLLSELVTNSVRHAGRPPGRVLAVGVELAPEWLLRVEVADACDDAPVLRRNGEPAAAESGRGLVLVEAMAAAWGTYPRAHVGKVVWFTLGLAETARRGGFGARRSEVPAAFDTVR